MNSDSIAGTILVRDQYRYTRLYYVTRMLAIVASMLALSVLGNVWLLNQPPLYRYLMTNPTGELMTLVPLEQPNIEDEEVIKWTVDAVTRIHTFDFMNYRTQFQEAQKLLTASGWVWFEEALRKSGNFTAVVRNRYVTTAVPTGPAVVTKKGAVVAGDVRRYQWTIEFPMLVTYRSSTQTTSQDLSLQVTVGRMPEYINRSGLGVRQILAK